MNNALEIIDAKYERDEAEWFQKILWILWMVTIVIMGSILVYSGYRESSTENEFKQFKIGANQQIEKLTIEKNVLIEAKSCK